MPSLAPPPRIVIHTTRPPVRALARAAFPHRHARIQIVRTAADLAGAFRASLVDAVLVDLGAPSDEGWRAASLAREFPSAPFFALTPLRTTDAPVVARCAELDVADVLIDGIDDAALQALVLPAGFSARFADALAAPPVVLGLISPLQTRTWSRVVAHAGLPVRTDGLARSVGVTREHLSRVFALGAGPTLKRVIDLVRLVAAAELAKNPGFDLENVATVLGFSSLSHLSATAQRVLGVRAASLARLRAVDLFERCARAVRA